LFPDGNAAGLHPNHLRGQLGNPWGCKIGGNATGMDIGDEVSPSIVVPRPGAIGHVGRKAESGCQSWPFADQEHGNHWVKDLAQLIEHAHAGVADEKRLAELPAPAAGFGCEHGQKPGDLSPNRRG
jgi:hypothetical protein